MFGNPIRGTARLQWINDIAAAKAAEQTVQQVGNCAEDITQAAARGFAAADTAKQSVYEVGNSAEDAVKPADTAEVEAAVDVAGVCGAEFFASEKLRLEVLHKNGFSGEKKRVKERM
jgi:hypothetical protein